VSSQSFRQAPTDTEGVRRGVAKPVVRQQQPKPAINFKDDPAAMDGSFKWESKIMTTETEKNLLTAAGVAAWVAMLALSQESAALDNSQPGDFARYSDWRAHLMATAPCDESLIPMLAGSERTLICSDALYLSSDRDEADGNTQVADTDLLRGATYTAHSGMIVAVLS
jgi:hypothetical protein